MCVCVCALTKYSIQKNGQTNFELSTCIEWKTKKIPTIFEHLNKRTNATYYVYEFIFVYLVQRTWTQLNEIYTVYKFARSAKKDIKTMTKTKSCNTNNKLQQYTIIIWIVYNENSSRSYAIHIWLDSTK